MVQTISFCDTVLFVAGGVWASGVVPVLQIAVDVVEVSFGGDDQSIEGFGLEGLDDALDMGERAGIFGTSRHAARWTVSNPGGYFTSLSRSMIVAGRCSAWA